MICELLAAFVDLMENKNVLMTCQNTALKHLPTIIPHLSIPGVFDVEKLTYGLLHKLVNMNLFRILLWKISVKICFSDFLVQLLINPGANISARYRLNFVRDVVNSDIFFNSSSRENLLPKV